MIVGRVPRITRDVRFFGNVRLGSGAVALT